MKRETDDEKRDRSMCDTSDSPALSSRDRERGMREREEGKMKEGEGPVRGRRMGGGDGSERGRRRIWESEAGGRDGRAR